MKVLLINGSPRENGNTFTALSEVAKALNEEGIETEIISIGKQAVHPWRIHVDVWQNKYNIVK